MFTWIAKLPDATLAGLRVHQIVAVVSSWRWPAFKGLLLLNFFA